MKICICGGGNLGHVIAGFVAAKGEDDVRILTRMPDKWADTLTTDLPDGTSVRGRLGKVSADAASVVADADVVLLCLPGFSIEQELRRIAPVLRPGTVVGSVVSSTGFYFAASRVLPEGTPLFGFQRVPFISRTVEYGHRGSLLGFRKSMVMGMENVADKEKLRLAMQRMLSTPVQLANNMYEVSLTNSNPLLHTSRLYSMWKEWKPGFVYASRSMFYEDWTDEAAALYIAMDKEFQRLLTLLPVSQGCIPTVLDYYESHDAPSLARKLRSISAFKGIPSPMKQVTGGYVPDFSSRYFTEDFPFGLGILCRLAKEKALPTPTLDKVYSWGREMIMEN